MKRRMMLLTTLLWLFMVACVGGGGSDSGGGDSSTDEADTQVPANALEITMAYSPEKEPWLQERMTVFNDQQNQVNGQTIFVTGTSVSSGKARTEIKNNQISPTIWSPSASTWLEVLKQETGNPDVAVSSEPLVLTPVVISMWKPMAEAMGWPEESIGWGDMLELIDDPEGWGRFGHPEWGKFSWGHTDPEISTTALSTLIAEFYAATGKQRDLTVADVEDEQSTQFIRDLGKGIKHYGYNTLVFSENMRKFGISYISAFPMEEITLIEFNQTNPTVPLVAIYPEEGTFMHDDPFIIMASATSDEQEAAQQFFDFLTNEESQRLAMSYGFRPTNTEVPLDHPISEAMGVEPQGVQNILDVPSAEVIVAAKDTWKQNRKRADILLVVDVSGSMDGEKLELVKAGLETFLLNLLPEDRVGLVTFSGRAMVPIEPAPLSENRIALQTAIQNMQALDQTALYDAVAASREMMQTLEPMGDERIQAIILLSDGDDNASGITLDQLAQEQGEADISIFPIAYGSDANMAALERIADFSRTIVVQGSTGDIAQVFENMSRYF